jgi:hypothetical protein
MGMMASSDENYIAAKIVENYVEKGISGNQLAEIYLQTLSTGEVLNDNVLNARKLRTFLLKKIDA